jgi:hypothetical protein
MAQRKKRVGLWVDEGDEAARPMQRLQPTGRACIESRPSALMLGSAGVWPRIAPASAGTALGESTHARHVLTASPSESLQFERGKGWTARRAQHAGRAALPLSGFSAMAKRNEPTHPCASLPPTATGETAPRKRAVNAGSDAVLLASTASRGCPWLNTCARSSGSMRSAWSAALVAWSASPTPAAAAQTSSQQPQLRIARLNPTRAIRTRLADSGAARIQCCYQHRSVTKEAGLTRAEARLEDMAAAIARYV